VKKKRGRPPGQRNTLAARTGKAAAEGSPDVVGNQGKTSATKSLKKRERSHRAGKGTSETRSNGPDGHQTRTDTSPSATNIQFREKDIQEGEGHGGGKNKANWKVYTKCEGGNDGGGNA